MPLLCKNRNLSMPTKHWVFCATLPTTMRQRCADGRGTLPQTRWRMCVFFLSTVVRAFMSITTPFLAVFLDSGVQPR
jgi:hypothetical protein